MGDSRYEHHPNPSRFDAHGCRKELTFTGRILNGEQAKDVGLVTRVADDPFAAAMELAEEIAVSHRMRCAQVRRCTNKRGMPTHEQA